MATTPRSIFYPVSSDSGDIAAHMQTTATSADSAITAAVPTGFKNVLINGNFDVWQRGSTLAAVTSANPVYNADRWFIGSNANTATPTRVQLTQAEMEAMKKPGYTYALQVATTQSSATADYTILGQKIEDVRSLAGEQVTLSFWAKAASGTPKIAVDTWRYYGAGGSPSTADTGGNHGQVTINTTMTRYSITFTMPSMTSKTLGTDGNSSLSIELWFTAGTDFNARTGTMGRQTNTFTIADIQLERGPVATLFDHRSRQQELALCQRYYYRIQAAGSDFYFSHGMYMDAAAQSFHIFHHPTPMRTPPSSVSTDTLTKFKMYPNDLTITGITLTSTHNGNTQSRVDVTGTGGSGTASYMAAALGSKNSNTPWIAFDAELP